MRHELRRLWWLLILPGCAEVLDIPDDPALVGRWRCLADPPARAVPVVGNAAVQVAACDFVDNCATSVSGLTARLCAQRDVGCTNPLQVDILDVDGLLSFEVPTGQDGFNGYLEVMSGTAPCTDAAFGESGQLLCGLCDPMAPADACQVPIFARAMLFFNPPILEDVAQPFRLPLIRAAAIPTMLQAAGAALDPTTGNLFITALDCDGQPAAGVTYGLGGNREGVTQLYVHAGLPTRTELETDSSGVGGFLGVTGGFANVTGYNENGEVVGEVGVQAAPFTMTYAAVAPN